MSERTIIDRYMSVSYLRVEVGIAGTVHAGGSGERRVWLSEIPSWLARNPGLLIVSMREVT